MTRAVQNHSSHPRRGALFRVDFNPGCRSKRSTRGQVPCSRPGWPRRRRASTLAPGTRSLRTRGKNVQRVNRTPKAVRGFGFLAGRAFPRVPGLTPRLRIEWFFRNHRFPRPGDAFGEQPCGRSGWCGLTGRGVEGFRFDIADVTAVLADGR